MGEGAGDGEDRKQGRAGQHVAAAREHPAEVIGQRDDHDLANQIRGRDPRAVVDARPCADSRSVFVERLVAVDAQRSS